jgi:hypothetical protein
MNGELFLGLALLVSLLGLLYLLWPKSVEEQPRFTTPHRNGRRRG